MIFNTGSVKKYTLPSGEIVPLRGYEPQFLDHVFKHKLLSEDEIIYEVSHVKYELSGKIRRYFPDFYIPKWNLIIEIKSSFTKTLAAEGELDAKEQAVRNASFDFLMVTNNKFAEFDKLCKSKESSFSVIAES